VDANSFLVAAGDGDQLRHPLGDHVTFKIRGSDSGGTVTVFETQVAPGAGPPLHVHANEEEVIYVLDGKFRFQLGDEVTDAAHGALMFVARGVPHCFQNVGYGRGRLLITFTPAGMERFFELAAGNRSAFEAAGEQVGMTVVGPPLGAT
jgi:quercetin dioxygenase-like cupin family protein